MAMETCACGFTGFAVAINEPDAGRSYRNAAMYWLPSFESVASCFFPRVPSLDSLETENFSGQPIGFQPAWQPASAASAASARGVVFMDVSFISFTPAR